MTNNENAHIIEVENTSNYGVIKENLIIFDIKNNFEERLLDYRLQKIKCQTEKNTGIIGLEIVYREKDKNHIIKAIDLITSNSICDEVDQFEFESMEMVTGLTIWKNKKNDKFSGFEIKTNKMHQKSFGICNNTSVEKIELDEFSAGNNYLLGFFGGFDKKDGLSSMGFYYINKSDYYLVFYYGYFELRIRLKRKEYKNEIEKQKDKMSQIDKAIFMTACLPSNQFYEILKFTFN